MRLPVALGQLFEQLPSHQPATQKTTLRHCLQERSPFHRKLYGHTYFQERLRSLFLATNWLNR
jgi:hypothetical protein